MGRFLETDVANPCRPGTEIHIRPRLPLRVPRALALVRPSALPTTHELGTSRALPQTVAKQLPHVEHRPLAWRPLCQPNNNFRAGPAFRTPVDNIPVRNTSSTRRGSGRRPAQIRTLPARGLDAVQPCRRKVPSVRRNRRRLAQQELLVVLRDCQLVKNTVPSWKVRH